MIPLLSLHVLLSWLDDLVHLKRPRSMNSFGPRLCTFHTELTFECNHRMQEQKKTTPRPLPSKRKRALTNPQELKRRQKTATQSRSPLLSKLPIEIKQMIYTNVLKGPTSTLHIVQKAYLDSSGTIDFRRHLRHLSSWPCLRKPHISLSNQWYPANTYMQTCSGHRDSWHRYGLELAPYGDWLPLLLTCRQIYAEGIDLLYSSHTFSFPEARLLNVFAPTVPPQRLNAIRKLHVEYPVPYSQYSWYHQAALPEFNDSDCGREEGRKWQIFCEIVNGMESLQELLIDVFNLEKCGTRTPQMERQALQPFMMIRAVEVFVVRVSWDVMGFVDESAPFRVVRARNAVREEGREGDDGIVMEEYDTLLPGSIV